jgi:hypothetical protein
MFSAVVGLDRSHFTFRFASCVKPNHGKVANQFDEELVQEQLRYNGILEISYIRNQGWPVRYTFDEFFQRSVDLSFCRASGHLACLVQVQIHILSSKYDHESQRRVVRANSQRSLAHRLRDWQIESKSYPLVRRSIHRRASRCS